MIKLKTLTALLIIVVIIIAIIPVTILEVYIFDKGDRFNEVIFDKKIEVSDEFTVLWTHSVSRRPVYETYEVNDDLTIDIKEMKFDTHSANLPSKPEKDQIWEFHDDYIRVYNYDIQFDEVPVVIGKVRANHRLIYNGEEINLKDLYRPGGYVKIRIVKRKLIEYLLRGNNV